jgi:hypothetical protein
MEPQDEPNWEAIWDWIKADASINIAAWQAQWLEHPNCRRTFDPIEAEYAQRRAGRAFIRRTLQNAALASAINRGDIGSYIRAWHPAPTPNGPAPGIVHRDEADSIPFTWRAITEEEASFDKFGVIRDEYEAIAGALGSGGDPAAVGGPDGSLAGPHQARQATARPVLARVLHHCLLALGRFLGVLNKARRNR